MSMLVNLFGIGAYYYYVYTVYVSLSLSCFFLSRGMYYLVILQPKIVALLVLLSMERNKGAKLLTLMK